MTSTFAPSFPTARLRVYVMGERGAALEPATDDDIAQMRALAREAMRAGALGFSTSRTLNHRTAKGDPTPSLRATEAELTGIAMGLNDAGAGVIELISDFDTPDPLTEFGMIRRIVEASGRPLSLSLAQAGRIPDGWRGILGMIEGAAHEGLPIRAQVAPRPIGMLLGLQGTLNPFSAHETFAAIKDKPLAEKVAIMRDPEFRARMLAETDARQSHPLARRVMAFEHIFPLGRSAGLRAAARNRASPRDGSARRPRRRRNWPTTCCWKTKAAPSCSCPSPITRSSISTLAAR